MAGEPTTTPSNDPGANTDPGTATPPAPAGGAANTEPDLSKLSSDQLAKVFDNPELWKHPRFAELAKSSGELKKLKEDQVKRDEEALTANKKFEELATKRGEENESLKSQLKASHINQALASKLLGQNVVDLDGALKLIDQSKVSVDDNGQVQGIDDAIAALKTDKAYLFKEGTQSLGSPTNPGNNNTPPAGSMKFKSSQITPEFYKANEKEILEAYTNNLVEDDGPPRQ